MRIIDKRPIVRNGNYRIKVDGWKRDYILYNYKYNFCLTDDLEYDILMLVRKIVRRWAR